MMTRTSMLTAAVVTALAVVPVACGGDDDDTSGSSSDTTATSETTASGTEEEFEDYVGLTLAEAEAKAEADGMVSRVIEEDGESLPATMDYREDRLNFVVEDGTVVRVTVG